MSQYPRNTLPSMQGRQQPAGSHQQYGGLPTERAGETGNIWYDQLQMTPVEAARLEAYAKGLGVELNWRLPLKPVVLEGSLAPATFDGQTPESRDGWTIEYQFPQGSYVTRLTGFLRGAAINSELVGPFTQYMNPLDYVDLSIVRNNSEAFTNNRGNSMYVAASAILGTGRLPYQTDLILFFTQAERLVINVRFHEDLERHRGFAMQLHYMVLPFGTVARGA